MKHTEVENGFDMSALPNPCSPLTAAWYGDLVGHFQEHPGSKVAIEGSGEIWTYAELDMASRKIGHFILSHELAAQPRWETPLIAINACRSPLLVTALLSIIRAGCAFMVLDAGYPAGRLAKCVRLARPEGLLNISGQPLPSEVENETRRTGVRFILDLPETKQDVLAMPVPGGDSAAPLKEVGPNDTLYVSFTSGTTGEPRAVVGSHAPLGHFFEWQRKTFGLTSRDRVSMLSGLAHDPLLRDVLMPLWVGATICVPPTDCYEEPNRLYEWMFSDRISVAHMTPGLGHLLLAHETRRRQSTLPDLRHVFLGGDVLRYRLVQRLSTAAPEAALINCYGTTETPQVVGFHVVAERACRNGFSDADSNAIVPIGKGISDCQLLVLDERNKLCNPGEEGEIFVRSPYLAKDLLDGAGTARGAFIENPYASDPADRLYRTGDRGQYGQDGSVVFKGRRDRQVKLRGYRVELAEIDNTVAADNSVRQHFVDIDGESDEEKRIVLYVVRAENSTGGKGNLTAALSASLPQFMIPHKIIELPALPLTPNGKIDKARLRVLCGERTIPEAEAIGFPVSTTAASLLRVVRETLHDQRLTLEDNPAQIGMNSLQAVCLACEIDKEFGVPIGVGEILQQPSIRSLAAFVGGFPRTRNGAVRILEAAAIPAQTTEDQGGRRSQQGRSSPHSNAVTDSTGGEALGPRLFPRNERFIIGVKNRVLQLLARVAPDVCRILLHRLRGVEIGENVSIGYDSIIETAYPWLVRLGNEVNIGMRVTIIAHFRGMAPVSTGTHTVDIRDGAFIGPGVIVLPNVVIGEGAVVASGSVVNTSVPALTLVQGNPASPKARCGVALTGKTTYEEFIRKLAPI